MQYYVFLDRRIVRILDQHACEVFSDIVPDGSLPQARHIAEEAGYHCSGRWRYADGRWTADARRVLPAAE